MPNKPVAKFSVNYLQVLDENGKLDAKLDPKLSDDQLLEMHRWMRLARAMDERMLKLQRQGRLGTFPPCTGQEAISIPIALAMQKNDWFAGAFRELGGRLVRGESLVQTLLYYNGFEEGNVMPTDDTRLLPISVVIGCQFPHAAGLAYAAKYKGDDAAAVAFIGDGGTSEGDFHEGLNFAAAWKAPAVFVCQNNQWAISIPRGDQTPSETIAQKGIAYGIPSVQVDGNDPLAVHVAITEALDRARAGEGPTFIEAVTYRLMMHTTADDPQKYRGVKEEEEAWAKEPLIRFEKYLRKKGIWDDAKAEALQAELKAQVDAAVTEFESPELRARLLGEIPFDHVYGEPHPYIEEQRQEFLDILEKEGGHA